MINKNIIKLNNELNSFINSTIIIYINILNNGYKLNKDLTLNKRIYNKLINIKYDNKYDIKIKTDKEGLVYFYYSIKGFTVNKTIVLTLLKYDKKKITYKEFKTNYELEKVKKILEKKELIKDKIIILNKKEKLIQNYLEDLKDDYFFINNK